MSNSSNISNSVEPKPLLFMSHKHSNENIAKVIEEFITTRSAGKVKVFLSSDPGSESPRIGQNLNNELKQALWEAGAVLLVYTSSDYDWSYCMWECGVAIDPQRSDTKVYVLQCGNDYPQPFADTVRVRGRKLDDIEKFVRQLLTDKDFFPKCGKITSFSPEDPKVIAAAKELFDKLSEVLPDEGPPNQWDTWPFLQIELKQEMIDQMFKAEPSKQRELLLSDANIVKAGAMTAAMFGKLELVMPSNLQDIVNAWTSKYSSEDLGWLDSICQQLLSGSQKEIGEIDWALFREINGPKQYLPTVDRVKSVPGEGKMQFDIHFCHCAKTISVTSIMNRIDKIYRENLDKTLPEEIGLLNLLERLEKEDWNRIPIMKGNDFPHYIVHVSMIDKFIRRKASEGNKIQDLTLKDLLTEPEMKNMFETTFAVVSKNATVTEAKLAMKSVKRCLDVFVTENGGDDEKVLGWITDRDFAESRTGII